MAAMPPMNARRRTTDSPRDRWKPVSVIQWMQSPHSTGDPRQWAGTREQRFGPGSPRFALPWTSPSTAMAGYGTDHFDLLSRVAVYEQMLAKHMKHAHDALIRR